MPMSSPQITRMLGFFALDSVFSVAFAFAIARSPSNWNRIESQLDIRR